MAVKDLPIVSMSGKLVGRITLEDDFEALLTKGEELMLSPVTLTSDERLFGVMILPREATKR